MLARKEEASIGKFNNYPYPRPKENKKKQTLNVKIGRAHV